MIDALSIVRVGMAYCIAISLCCGQNLSEEGARLWKEDIHFLLQNMDKVHRNPFHTTSKEAFQRFVNDLDTKIGSSTENQVVVELMKMVAKIGDGHTFVNFFTNTSVKKFHSFPLRLYVFEDGLHVTHAYPEYQELVGTRVVQVGNKSVEACYRLVADLPQRDNEYQLKLMIPFYFTNAEVMNGLGVIEHPGQVTMVFENRQGERISRTIKSVDLPSFYRWLRDQPSPEGTPLYRQNTRKFYWLKHLEKERALYVGYNVVNIDPNDSLSTFCRRIEQLVSDHDIEKVIIDIRNNGGGDLGTCQPLVDFISHNPRINRRGHLFTIIGSATFSAASYFTTKMELNTETIFVGEPTGASPNHYGDNRPLILPNSKTEVRLSTILWGNTISEDRRPWTAPDIPVTISSEQYFNMSDPVLETILALDSRKLEFKVQISAGDDGIAGDFLFSPLNVVELRKMDGKIVLHIKDDDHRGREVSFVYTTLSSDGPGRYITPRENLRFSYDPTEGSLAMNFGGAVKILRRKPETYRTPGKAFREGNVEEGMAMIRQMWEERPFYKGFHEQFLNGWAGSYLQRKNVQAALGLFTFMIEVHPLSDLGYDGLAECYRQLGDSKRALESSIISLKLRSESEKLRQRSE